MTLRKALFLVCLAAATACLAGGYALARAWLGAAAALIPAAGFAFTGKYRAPWIPRLCLIALTGLAAGGIFAKAPVLLMVIGAAAALACWDLVHLDRMMQSAAEPHVSGRVEKKHVQWLGLAIGTGLSLAVIGTLVTLQMPLFFLILLVVLDVISLNFVARSLAK
jgi:hypothetical protein